jgi:hypothetical protein
MSEIMVMKREGGEEEWSFEKLLASIGKSGVEVYASTEIARRIEAWAKDPVNNGKVTSTQIRDKVIEFLTPSYPAQADSYAAYKI